MPDRAAPEVVLRARAAPVGVEELASEDRTPARRTRAGPRESAVPPPPAAPVRLARRVRREAAEARARAALLAPRELRAAMDPEAWPAGWTPVSTPAHPSMRARCRPST